VLRICVRGHLCCPSREYISKKELRTQNYLPLPSLKVGLQGLCLNHLRRLDLHNIIVMPSAFEGLVAPCLDVIDADMGVPQGRSSCCCCYPPANSPGGVGRVGGVGLWVLWKCMARAPVRGQGS